MLMRRFSSPVSMRVQWAGLRPDLGLRARTGAMTWWRSVRNAVMVRAAPGRGPGSGATVRA
jgi:hypothetical protein